MDIEKLKIKIQKINDPRRIKYGNIRHKLEDIIIIGLLTIICGGEDFADMEAFCKKREKRAVIAVDGKTIRGSKNKEHKAYHVVSAFVAENQITLGEITTSEKSNFMIALKENQLHWCLDVMYNEDKAKNRKDNSPLNMHVIRKTALSLVR